MDETSSIDGRRSKSKGEGRKAKVKDEVSPGNGRIIVRQRTKREGQHIVWQWANHRQTKK
jgi:ribosomal protein L27